MKNLFCLLITIIILSCNSKNQPDLVPKINGKIKTKVKITGHKYFEYDELLHYKIESEGNIGELYENQDKSTIDSLKMGIILGEIPKTIADSSFIGILHKIGYKKNKVNSQKFKAIDSIFTEKKHPDPIYSACVYIYRDILIFKKKSNIIGVAKICFECGGNIIVGTKSNTEEFGQTGDFWKLEEILKKDKTNSK